MTSKRLRVESDDDLDQLRERLRNDAGNCGLSNFETTKLLTVAKEVSRDFVDYTQTAEAIVESRSDEGPSVRVIVRNNGPGYENIERVIRDKISEKAIDGEATGTPDVKRLADEFEITSSPGVGTTVTFTVRGDANENRKAAEDTENRESQETPPTKKAKSSDNDIPFFVPGGDKREI